jgi:hypothetical protein
LPWFPKKARSALLRPSLRSRCAKPTHPERPAGLGSQRSCPASDRACAGERRRCAAALLPRRREPPWFRKKARSALLRPSFRWRRGKAMRLVRLVERARRASQRPCPVFDRACAGKHYHRAAAWPPRRGEPPRLRKQARSAILKPSCQSPRGKAMRSVERPVELAGLAATVSVGRQPAASTLRQVSAVRTQARSPATPAF